MKNRAAWTTAITGEKKVQAKFRNQKGELYHSGKEANRATVLYMWEKCGEITDLVEQPEFLLIPTQEGERAVKYIGDFGYTVVLTGEKVVEDVKSEITRKTPAYVIKRKLMLWIHGIKILET